MAGDSHVNFSSEEELDEAREEARLKALEEREGFQEFNLRAIENPVPSKPKEIKTTKTPEQREAEIIKKYGPKSKFKRDIVNGSTKFDPDQRKWTVKIVCSHPECTQHRRVATSDLFQTSLCSNHQQAKRRKSQTKKRKNKKSELDELVARRKREVAQKRAESARRAKRK